MRAQGFADLGGQDLCAVHDVKSEMIEGGPCEQARILAEKLQSLNLLGQKSARKG